MTRNGFSYIHHCGNCNVPSTSALITLYSHGQFLFVGFLQYALYLSHSPIFIFNNTIRRISSKKITPRKHAVHKLEHEILIIGNTNHTTENKSFQLRVTTKSATAIHCSIIQKKILQFYSISS